MNAMNTEQKRKEGKHMEFRLLNRKRFIKEGNHLLSHNKRSSKKIGI